MWRRRRWTGVARKPISDMEQYKAALARRLDPTAAILQNSG
jgi:malate dehydrogenase (oxaloacetate-decarboxylating)(NADP+)